MKHKVDTIVLVDEQDKRRLTTVSSIRRKAEDDDETLQRSGSQLLMTLTPKNSKFSCFRRICATIGARHFLLLIVYFTYLSAFAFLLQIIEKPRHVLMNRRQRLVALQKRHQFVSTDILPAIINTTELMLFVHGERTRRMGFILLKALDKYEQILDSHRVIEFEDPFQSFDQTLLFAFSSITTLGSPYNFHNSAKLSKHSKCIIVGFGLTGILLTVLVVADLASLLSRFLLKQQKMWSRFCRLVLCFVPKRGIRLSTQIEQPKDVPQCQEPSFVVLLICLTIWIYSNNLLLEIVGGTSLSFVDLLWVFMSAITTTGIYGHFPKDRPLFTYLVIPHLIIGFAIISLVLNKLCLKIYRLKANSTRVKEKKNCNCEEDKKLLVTRDETFSEFNETHVFDESLICSYHTVGIFQIESPTRIPKQITNCQEAATQTETISKETQTVQPKFRFKTPHRYSFGGKTSSHDDVQSLIRETYRPIKTAQE